MMKRREKKSRHKLDRLMLALCAVLLFAANAMLPDFNRARLLLTGEADEIEQDGGREAGEMEQEGDGDRESRPDRPDEAVRFRRLQLKDEKGFIPPDGLEKARQHVKQMRVARQGSVRPDSWLWRGPGNIGGRIRTIVIHPTNTTNMWLGSVGGGIWRTTDGGDSWWPVDDFLANLAVSTMVINPADTTIMYAGTGEQFAGSFNNPGNGFTPDGLLGAGVFKSTDSGLTWNRLASTNPGNTTVCPAAATPANCPWLYVNRLAISNDGSRVLAATGNNIQLSTDGGQSWNVGGGAATTFFDVDFHPTNNLLAVAGGEGQALFTTDGGQTWNGATFNPAISPQPAPPTNASARRIELAYAPSSPNIVYASVNQHQTAAPGAYRGETYQSTDGGRNYTRVNTATNALGGQGSYDNVIWVNPLDPTFVIVGGIDLWRSTNSGQTFTQISMWQNAPATSAHADHHVIVAHPNFNNVANRIVYFGNDGGIYRTFNVSTVDKTTGWEVMNNRLGITQFYGGAGSFNNGVAVIIGGAQDNGTVSSNGPTSALWSIVTDTSGFGLGDGGFCAADPSNPNYFYGEYVYLQIYRSTNGAVTASYIFSGITDANNANAANFIAPFILDPSNPDIMFAGGTSLWRSADVKAPTPAWVSIKGPVPPPPPPATATDVRISAVAVSPVSSNVIVVGHNNGDIYRTVTGTFPTGNSGKIDTAALPNRFVTRLLIDYTRPTNNWIYATFGGFSADNIYRTTDNGATWTDVSGTGVTGLPSVPVRSLVYHPRNPNLLFAGTEIGIFTSDDAGATWTVPQNGPANVSVDDLFWLGEDLVAVTHGRGMYLASGGIYVDCNYNGTQEGTFDRPYKTIAAALNATSVYRTIWIKPCNYNEPMTINKRFGVELRSLGGTATIGRP
jgi:photosystem II stability/assembly factor-like uncharacterized protein